MLQKTKIFFSIRSLNRGGAERQFLSLVKHIDKKKFEVVVCTMYHGVLDSELKTIPGIRHVFLGKKGRFDIIGFLFRYIRIINQEDPQVIYSFLGEMNIASFIGKFFVSNPFKLIWGFRASDMDLSHYGLFSRVIFKLQKWFSPFVDCIIANSHASVQYHKKQGFFVKRSEVVSNGIDVGKFSYSEENRTMLRSRLHLDESDIVVGVVARMDPMKGHVFFSRVMKKLFTKNPRVKCLFVGKEESMIKNECLDILESDRDKIVFLGEYPHTEEVYSALDIFVSPSVFGEGFSNSIAEAMSTGREVVTTDIGDASLIVGKCGRVVPPLDELLMEKVLVESMDDLTQREEKINLDARKRILENFSISVMVQKSEKLILDTLKRGTNE